MSMHPDDYRTQTMRAYDAMAATISEKLDAHFETSGTVELDYFVECLGKVARILDLGCGAGAVSGYFSHRGYTTVSADISRGMLEGCRRKGLPNIVRLDLENLSFEDRSFNGIWAATCLDHIPKRQLRNALAGIGRLLLPKGYLYVVLKEAQGEGHEGYHRYQGEVRWASYFRRDEFEEHITKGLEITRKRRAEHKGQGFLCYHLATG